MSENSTSENNDYSHDAENIMNKRIKDRLQGINLWSIVLSPVLFILMCAVAGLYTMLWRDELYTGLGIMIPIAVLLIIIGTILVYSGKPNQIRVYVPILHLLAGLCILLCYFVIRVNAGGHESEPEFYARRFTAIWFMVEFIITFCMYRGIKKEEDRMNEKK